MKTENESTTQPATSQTPTPQPYTPQWAASTSQIPIDPALQQQSQQATTSQYQHYQAYTSHYSQAAYSYQPYSAAAVTSATAQNSATTQRATTATTATNAASSNSNSKDTSDIATLNDALGSAGVDLRAEEETLQRSHEQAFTYRSFEDRTRKQPPTPSFDTRILGATMRTIGTQHKVARIPDDAVNYLALALRARLQDLVTAMIAAAHHRTDSQFDGPPSLYEDGQPMWSVVVRSDIAKQLAALEKVEREEELRIRRERKERLDMANAHAAVLAAQASGMATPMAVDGGDEEGGAKKKRKKDGPGVTARNMSEDVRKKMSNAVATQAAGLGGRYAWMTASATSLAPPPKPKTGAAAGTTTTTTTTTSGAAGSTTSGTTTTAAAATTTTTTGSWARPYVAAKPATSSQSQTQPEEEDTRTVINMRDAMFVIEKERGHGGGRGAANGWV